jgi:hypothetical protein
LSGSNEKVRGTDEDAAFCLFSGDRMGPGIEIGVDVEWNELR